MTTRSTSPRFRTLPIRLIQPGWFAVLVSVLALGGSLSGCASLPNEGNRLFAAGDWEAALPALERQLVAPKNPRNRRRARTLYQLALIYARPDTPAFDPRKAGRLFDRLIAEYPNSPHRAAADAVRGLGRQLLGIERTMRERDDRIAILERQDARCRARLAEVPAPPPPNTAAMDGQRLLSEERATCHDTMSRLRAEVARRDDRISRLTSALEALKRIDTESGGADGRRHR